MQKLLIVDDNQQITAILAEYAQKNHYQVIIAMMVSKRYVYSKVKNLMSFYWM